MITLSACGALGLGAGADVKEIEEDYPAMSDLEIEGATRVNRSRVSSNTRVGGVRQQFEPTGETTLETLAERAIAAGIQQGWDVRKKAAPRSGWCASKPRRDPADGFVTLEVTILDTSSLSADTTAVNLLLHGSACATE